MFHKIDIFIGVIIGLIIIFGIMVSMTPTASQKYCWSKGFTYSLGDKYCTKTVAGTDIVMSRDEIEKFKGGQINTNFPKR